MKLITMMIGALATGTLARQLQKRRKRDAEQAEAHARSGRPTVYDLSDEEAVMRHDEVPADRPEAEVSVRAARVTAIVRDMNPLTLRPVVVATFSGGDAPDMEFRIPGEYGKYLRLNEWGMLEHQGERFLSFTMDHGAVVGAMYYMPNTQEADG